MQIKLWWFTTPRELRHIADKLERRQQEAKLGESLAATEICLNDSPCVTVEISLDQDESSTKHGTPMKRMGVAP